MNTYKNNSRLPHFVSALVIFFASVILCGCTRTVYEPIEKTVYHTDTLRLSQLRVDSVVLHDSVVVAQRGDTVFMTKYRDRYRYRLRTDTLYKAVVDTARIEIPIPVEKPLTRWQKVKQDVGGMAIGGLLIAICILVIWLIKKFRK